MLIDNPEGKNQVFPYKYESLYPTDTVKRNKGVDKPAYNSFMEEEPVVKLQFLLHCADKTVLVCIKNNLR